MSGIFLPYQLKWINDESPLKVCEKGRREGVSWAEAYRTALIGAASKEAGGKNTYYMSYNKAMTRQFVSDVAFFATDVLKLAAMDMQEVVIQNDKQDITMYRIVFDSGFEVVGMPSDAYNLRSKQGRVVLDEAAFCDDMEGVMKAAMALLIWGGQFSIISTHNGESSRFNQLIKEIRSGRQNKWSLHRVTFSEAIEQGLYKKICQKNGEPWSKEKEDAFIANIKEIYADNIDEELNCIPRASGDRYFGRGLLDHATADADSYDMRRLECSDSFLHKNESFKNREIEKFFNQEVRPVLGALEGQVFGGNDFGRSGDLTTYWFAEEVSKTQLAVRLIVELKNIPFAQQELFSNLITDFLTERGKFGGLAIDARGNGQELSENAMLRHPGAVIQIFETQQWYAKYGATLHGLMESGDFTVPDDETIKADFALVVLKNGVPTIPAVRTADRDLKGKRHGDAASAAMLCVCAWEEASLDPAPSFIPVEKKKSKFPWF